MFLLIGLTACDKATEIEVEPGEVTLSAGQVQQFLARVENGPTQYTSWKLNEDHGIVSPAGFYKAPYTIPDAVTIQLRASIEAPSVTSDPASATARIHLLAGAHPQTGFCSGVDQDRLPEIGEMVSMDLPPKPVSRVLPEYPPDALASGLEGMVGVLALICTTGTVLETWVVDSVPGLDRAASDAALQWIIRPGVFAGESVASWIYIPFEFRIESAGRETKNRRARWGSPEEGEGTRRDASHRRAGVSQVE
jgi:TonB family protein